MPNVINEIAAERRRQIEVEGWTAQHDDEHDDGSLAAAAACYAHPLIPLERRAMTIPSGGYYWIPSLWPPSWADKWWKPKDRRRDLIRAAALIVADIERLDRAATRPTPDAAEE